MSSIANLVKELLGQEVSVETRTSQGTYGGVLAMVDVAPLESAFGPTVALKDEEGKLSFVFDVSAISPGLPQEVEDEEEEEEEEEEEDWSL